MWSGSNGSNRRTVLVGEYFIQTVTFALSHLEFTRIRMHSSAYASRTAARKPAGPNMLDFDDEARALWDRLNLDPTSRKAGLWNPLDSIWRHPEGGGTIYVGNQTAAENLTLLK